ncbi:hypothetical protein [Thiofilum flexile]|uniref:hypothetical protein n=1 Tax=Thiofilum flexile TaxID=125627 RepID=UPI00035D3618|nr:hypothetical protein [Thiofilum flexile]
MSDLYVERYPDFPIVMKEKLERLGLKCYTPFILRAKEKTYYYSIMIPFLGCKYAENGLVISTINLENYTPPGKAWDVAAENGYIAYDAYYENTINMSDDELKQSLNHFYWYEKKEDAPSWHTGEFYPELFHLEINS